jgi:site-specific DNA recombinase
MRAAIYARYSSKLQDHRSIEDQIRICRERAQREGWSVIEVYEDAGISGAAMVNRPGLLRLRADAAAKKFEIIVAESIDRISRDLADISTFYRDLKNRGVRINTVGEGEIEFLHVGLKGIVGQMYLADLAIKTRRGQLGRVAAGRIPGGQSYGYSLVQGAERGLRTINEEEAAVVRRIFLEYVGGQSPRAITKQLNAERVPSPRGGLWNASTLNGSRKRANGILSNSLYAGEIVYNRQRFIKDPSTGKRQARPNPPAEWRRQAVPELAIVDAETWEAAQAIRSGFTGHSERQRRPKRLLSGLMSCGCCGGSYIIRTRHFVGCSHYVNTGTCDNKSVVSVEEVERRVVAAVRAHLLAPDAVAAAVEAYREERARLAKERLQAGRQAERDLAEVDRKLTRLVDAIESGAGEVGPLVERMRELEGRRRDLEAIVPKPTTGAVVLHPQASKRYRDKIEELHATLADGANAQGEAAKLFRELISAVRITPQGKLAPVSIEIVGDLAALMLPPGGEVTGKVVAGIGFEPMTFRL